MPTDVTVRPAGPDERPAVANVIDGAALELDGDLLQSALETDDALVAVPADADATAQILGAIVCDGETVVAVAVRRRRRDQGIGRALVEAAAARRDRMIAECDADVRPFWASLGFAVAPTDEDRFVCVR